MKNFINPEFQGFSVDESQTINGGVFAQVLTAAGLSITLYHSIITHSALLT